MASVIGPLDFAEQMEALGYRSYFVPELETLPTLDAFILLASVAQRTQHMRLGTGVAVLPFHTPYQIAKIATSIDVLSGGRMVLGLGSGGVFNDDFAVEGVRVEDRRGITDERLALVRRLLSETSVTHHGTFHSMENVTLEPRSVQQPHLPIWTGAMWNGSFVRRPLERTARWADGFHPHAMTPQGYAEGKAAIEEMAAAFGRDPAAFEWSCNMYLCMGQTRDDAYREVQASMRHRFGGDAWELDPGDATARYVRGLHRDARSVRGRGRDALHHQRPVHARRTATDLRAVRSRRSSRTSPDEGGCGAVPPTPPRFTPILAFPHQGGRDQTPWQRGPPTPHWAPTRGAPTPDTPHRAT